MNKVITISREFGSGGRELGMLIAQRFQIPFYDKELISLAAQDTLSAEVIEQYEEHLQLNMIWKICFRFISSPLRIRFILGSVKQSGNWQQKALVSL